FVCRLLAEHVQDSLPAREENQAVCRIKLSKVDARADRKAGDDFPRSGIHDRHQRFFAAANKQPIGLRIVSETSWDLRHADREALLRLQLLRIEPHAPGCALAVDAYEAICADSRLLAVSLCPNRADHLAGRRVDGSDIVRTVIIGKDA